MWQSPRSATALSSQQASPGHQTTGAPAAAAAAAAGFQVTKIQAHCIGDMLSVAVSTAVHTTGYTSYVTMSLQQLVAILVLIAPHQVQRQVVFTPTTGIAEAA
jgi:hypothetical protein